MQGGIALEVALDHCLDAVKLPLYLSFYLLGPFCQQDLLVTLGQPLLAHEHSVGRQTHGIGHYSAHGPDGLVGLRPGQIEHQHGQGEPQQDRQYGMRAFQDQY